MGKLGTAAGTTGAPSCQLSGGRRLTPDNCPLTTERWARAIGAPASCRPLSTARMAALRPCPTCLWVEAQKAKKEQTGQRPLGACPAPLAAEPVGRERPHRSGSQSKSGSQSGLGSGHAPDTDLDAGDVLAGGLSSSRSAVVLFFFGSLPTFVIGCFSIELSFGCLAEQRAGPFTLYVHPLKGPIREHARVQPSTGELPTARAGGDRPRLQRGR